MNNIPHTKKVKGKLIIYEYIRGSHCHGLETETSDVDYGGVFIEPNELLLGLGDGYDEQINNETNDITYWEFNKFMRLVSNSNPNALESLFVDDEFVTVMHPMFREIRNKRYMFITKKCFGGFGSYSLEQIRKARGLNKKIVNPIYERKEPLDFCHVFYNQGSTAIKNWLEHRGLKQEYCGLVNIPNMYNCYGVYYDWGNHFANENFDWGSFALAYTSINSNSDEQNDTPYQKLVGFFCEYFKPKDISELKFMFESIKPIGYKGIVGDDGKSTSVRLSSVEKGVLPICYANYNEDGYKSHCKRYKEYKEWEEKRNKVRYESNLKKNYDAKNMSECVRLVKLCTEIAKGEGVKLNRKNIDREFLLDIKHHKYEYDELMKIVVGMTNEMEEAVKTSTLPDDISFQFVDSMTKEFRKNFKPVE